MVMSAREREQREFALDAERKAIVLHSKGRARALSRIQQPTIVYLYAHHERVTMLTMRKLTMRIYATTHTHAHMHLYTS